MFEKPIDYKISYQKNIHDLTKSGSYFQNDNAGNLNFILFSSLIDNFQNFNGTLGLNFQDNYSIRDSREPVRIELNHKNEITNYKTIDFTNSNNVNNFGTVNNKKQNTKLSSLVIKYRNFELGYQKDGDTNFNSDKVFLGVEFNLSDLLYSLERATNLITRSEDNYNQELRELDAKTKIRINSDKQSIINFNIKLNKYNFLNLHNNISYDFTYYMGNYQKDDTESLRSVSKLSYEIYSDKEYKFKTIEFNYLTYKNTSINNLIYLDTGLEIELI